MQTPLLSIGMIVKNEIKYIERCMKALQPLRDAIPCELVIVDTGSTDGTREIIEQYADKLLDFEWINDFSAARNVAMDNSTGKWYMTIDADEYLDENVQPLVDILTGSIEPEINVITVTVRNYSSPDMEHSGFSDFYAVRLLKMSTGVRYQGTIHEAWCLDEKMTVYHQKSIILHHVGYAYTSEEQQKKKNERNMELLRIEYQKHPNNFRIINQCIESSGAMKQEQIGYRLHAMELLLKKPSLIKEFGATSACRYALVFGLQEHYYGVENWLEFAEKYCQNSDFFKIDVQFACANYFSQKKEYETALEYVYKYLNAMQERSKGIYNLKEKMNASLLCDRDYNVEMARLMGVKCLSILERFSEALEMLKQVDVYNPRVKPELIQAYMFSIVELRDNPQAQQCVSELYDYVKQWKDSSTLWEKTMYFSFYGKMQQYFNIDGEDNWKLYLKLPGDMGLAAQILNSQEPEEAQVLAEEIDDWLVVSPCVLAHLVRKGVPLPKKLLTYPAERLQSIASYLVTKKELHRALEQWVEQQDFTQSLPAFQFYYYMLVALIRTQKWNKKTYAMERCKQFIEQGRQYLYQFYHPKLLENQQNWAALPSMHHYALCLIYAIDSAQAGDQLGYVQNLKQALKVAPTMKDMVDFMLDHEIKPENPELERMAKQVKAMLSQYAADDPAVIALKASPVYQRVAYLVEAKEMLEEDEPEQPNPIYEQPAPELTQQLEAILNQAREQSSQQMENLLQEHFEQASQEEQEKLQELWNKNLAWKDAPKEVFANIAQLFTTQADQLNWLYEHLQDNQSRSTLVHILESWKHLWSEENQSWKESTKSNDFDTTLFRCTNQDVVVELGAGTGIRFLDLVKEFGVEGYKKYYAYEMNPTDYLTLTKTTRPYANVICRNQDVREYGQSIDECILMPIGLLKFDHHSAQKELLLTCKQHICTQHPNLVFSVHHKFQDIWELAYIIDQWVSGYRFYLRHSGGTAWESRLTLIGIPPQ